MFKRSLVLGGLIAGAFLLPVVANAAVTGVCSNCHTMHDSQNGVGVGPSGPGHTSGHATLLSSDCVGCHASATQNDATGRDTASPFAPQVDNVTAGVAGFVNNAGYFDSALASDATRHNVVDLSDVDGTLGNNPPGGAALGAQISCVSCHAGSGAHHQVTPSSYRILSGTNGTTSTQTDFGAVAKTAALTSGSRAEAGVVYNATDMNNFCASCHGGFHQGLVVGMGVAGDQYTGANGVWLRHPTDVAVVNDAVTAPSIKAITDASDNDAVVVGTAGTANIVMCISCHVPHGGPYADLLSFDYSLNSAGAGGSGVGCETCHGYAANPGSGM